MQEQRPYPGLRPFDEQDASFFFGRTEIINKLIKKLTTSRFIAVMGESGCGKSSLVRAGLFPELKSNKWIVATMKPGNDPLKNLAHCLEILADEHNDEQDTELWKQMILPNLNMNSNGISEVVEQSQHKGKLLLCIDQFEEVIDYAYEKSFDSNNSNARYPHLQKAIQFINLIVSSVNQTEHAVYVMITMRSDFLGACARFKGLPELINNGQFLVPRLTRYQYQEAITGPLKKKGYEIDSNVVSQLLNDIEDDPDQLPILQHALSRTWIIKEQKIKEAVKAVETTPSVETPLRWITMEDYNAAGGRNAIQDHAAELLKTIVAQNLFEPTKKIFKFLTELVLTKNEEDGIRKRRTVAQLQAISGVNRAELLKILKIYCAPGVHFLSPTLCADSNPDGDVSIDLCHESLIRKWPDLLAWMQEENLDKTMLKRLIEEAETAKKNKNYYLSKGAIYNFTSWERYKDTTFKIWARRYTKPHDLDYALGFIRKSKSITNRQFIASRALLGLALIIGIVYLGAINHLNRNFKIVSGLSKNEFDSFFKAVKQNYGTYPAYVTADNWAKNTNQLLNISFVVRTNEIKEFIKSLEKKANDELNSDPLYGYLIAKEVKPVNSISRNYLINYDFMASDTIEFTDIKSDTTFFRVHSFFSFNMSNLNISVDERTGFTRSIEAYSPYDYPFLQHRKKNIDTIHVFDILSGANFQFAIPSLHEDEFVDDIVTRGNGKYDVFVKSRSVKGTSTVTKWLYSRVKGVEKTQFNIKVESFENSGYGGYTDVELKERFLIIASEVPAVYDKIEDKIIELDRSLYNVSLNAYLKGTNNAGLAFDDSSQVIYQNKVYTKIHEKYRKKDISVTKIDFLNDRWFIANVSVRQRFINSDFVVYDLQSDRLHSLSSVQVDPIQYYIPLCNENVIIVEQPLNSSKSFFWFFNNGQRIAKNWDEYSKLPEKYQYSEAALDSMGIQPTKTK